MLHQGANFSLYASGNCKRVQREKIDLMLECRFEGKQATLVLKEFPDTRPPLVAERNQDPDLVQRWARNALGGIDPELGSRVRLSGGSSEYGETSAPTILNRFGFLYKNSQDATSYSQDFEKRVLVRVHYSLGYGVAVLVAMSDFDQTTLMKPNRGVPDELLTTFRSLDLVERRRFPL
jgi:hypothetical protein